jgi:O-antigen/teichoic acid export membrane protein
VQKIMQERGLRGGLQRQALIEAGIAAVSIAGLVAIILLLALFPRALGNNVALASYLFLPMLLVPAFRNLVEYQAELLYARERTGSRVVLLCAVAALKTVLISWVMTHHGVDGSWAPWLNAVFGAVYLLSTVFTYRLLGKAR